MKKYLYLCWLLSLLLPQLGQSQSKKRATTAKPVTYMLDASASSIHWNGKKVIGEAHQGVLAFKGGKLLFTKSGKLKGGTLWVDMASIEVLDLTDQRKAKLEAHLKSADFFAVKEYPTASLHFKRVTENAQKGYEVLAEMTIKGVTKTVSFTLSPAIAERSFQATLTIDRTLFGVCFAVETFSDYLAEKAINKDFSLKVTLIY